MRKRKSQNFRKRKEIELKKCELEKLESQRKKFYLIKSEFRTNRKD